MSSTSVPSAIIATELLCLIGICFYCMPRFISNFGRDCKLCYMRLRDRTNRRLRVPNSRRTEGSREEEECAICLVELSRGENITTLNCNHYFHTDCLKDWWNHSNVRQCPFCRSLSV